MKTETRVVQCDGTQLANVIAEALADGWKVVGQTTLGAGEFELTLARDVEGEA